MLLFGQKRNGADRTVCIGNHSVQQTAELRGHAVNGRRIEEIAVVLKDADQPFGLPGRSVPAFLKRMEELWGTGNLLDIMAPSLAHDARLRRWYGRYERASLPPARQVLVRTIPETGRRALYTASHAIRVIGLPEDESTRLLDELMAHATQRQFVYTHRWRLHDLVLWDNRCTMHRGTDYDERRWKRDMHRATVSDTGNTITGTA